MDKAIAIRVVICLFVFNKSKKWLRGRLVWLPSLNVAIIALNYSRARLHFDEEQGTPAHYSWGRDELNPRHSA